MTTFNTDITYYACFNDFGPRIGIDSTNVSDRKTLVEDIRSGQLGFENVVKILAFNAAEHTCDDVTDDILAEVEAAAQCLRDLEDFPLSRFSQAAE